MDAWGDGGWMAGNSYYQKFVEFRSISPAAGGITSCPKGVNTIFNF
jgi:hypothetical protein